MQALKQSRALTPLHIPPELDTIKAAREHFPKAEQIACFDNHFCGRKKPARTHWSG